MKSKTSARIARRAVAVLVVAALAGSWWAFLRPVSIADGPLQLIIVSGESMEPGLYTGDLAVLYRRDAYITGDVVAYRSGRIDGEPGEGSGPFIIHRITGGNAADGFVLRGDNTSVDDPWQPTATDVAGEMVFSVPAIGGAVEWLSRPIHLGALLASLFVTLVVAPEPRRRGAAGQSEVTAVEDDEVRRGEEAVR